MGNICAKKKVKTPVDDPNPDPVTGLTGKDRRLIWESWQQLLQTMKTKEIGEQLLYTIFQKHPHLLLHFKELRDLELQDLKGNVPFRAHALSLVLNIAAYVECLDESEILTALIHRNINKFIKHGFTTKDVENIACDFIDFIGEKLGKDLDSEEMKAWNKFFEFQHAQLASSHHDLVNCNDK